MILGHSDKLTFTAKPQELRSFFKILLLDCLCSIPYQYYRPIILLIAAGFSGVLCLFVILVRTVSLNRHLPFVKWKRFSKEVRVLTKSKITEFGRRD